MNVLICKNIEKEGPGTIEDFLQEKGIRYTIVELSRGEAIAHPEQYNTLVMMGGPMSVNDEARYPYIMKEAELVREFVLKDKKVLGICLGAQIMAKALGAKVYKGREKEIGWHDISATEEGSGDELFSSLLAPNSCHSMVFHWHGDTFDIPSGAVRMAGSDLYMNQAFRCGKNAYALQFHIEVRKEMILDWLKDEPDFQKIKLDTETFYEEYTGRAEDFYRKFFS